MKRIAFIDIKDEPAAYLLEKSGGGYRLKETVRAFSAGTYRYRMERPLDETDECYLSLPMDLLNFRIVEFPFSDIGRIREVLPFELDNLVMGGSERVVFDVCLLDESGDKSSVLVVYVMKDVLRSVLDGLKASGIEVKVVTSIEAALSLGSFRSEREIADLVLERRRNAASADERVRAALGEAGRSTFNLRRGEFAYTGSSDRAKKSLRLTTVLGAALVIVLLSALSLRIISARKEAAALRDEIRKTYMGVFPAEKKVTGELYQFRAHMKEMREKENAYGGIAPLPMLLEVSASVGPGISLSELTIDKDRIVIKGESPSLSDVQKLKGGLERFLSGVAIADTKVSVQNRTAFTITARGRKS